LVAMVPQEFFTSLPRFKISFMPWSSAAKRS
jgi:hypothetical protein